MVLQLKFLHKNSVEIFSLQDERTRPIVKGSKGNAWDSSVLVLLLIFGRTSFVALGRNGLRIEGPRTLNLFHTADD